MKVIDRSPMRREPRQQRSRQTVDAVIEAVRVVVRRHGPQALTTNRIAEVAGVSVGSLYQYFPDKRSIFSAIHDRHVDDVREVVAQVTAACAGAPFDAFTRELTEAMVKVHVGVSDLHEIFSAAVPESAPGFKNSLRRTFESALSRGDPERYSPDEEERMLFVLPYMIESLVHGAAHQSSATLSRDRAGNEAIRTVLAYVNSFQGKALHPC